ncbi:uncharacterized protein LAESUDRAFT_714531 [Laetiporus sulphureus 93-53]|uniref:Uncharacterized protein n=1 Tax=Laetiporus sulphureus 93-53 TaxID=1314785 RepID=A0A165E3M3_9APHY|nr:uncharacterized protein LAESUDRAFT_714531 [Laetiporus sulphureus 93-53]KZT06187.1 hypothetical protein LAESUDRAFT_714531 [Laetiporus sulphureus 93-53]
MEEVDEHAEAKCITKHVTAARSKAKMNTLKASANRKKKRAIRLSQSPISLSCPLKMSCPSRNQRSILVPGWQLNVGSEEATVVHPNAWVQASAVKERGFTNESDEDVECFAALSSPVKGPNTQLTHCDFAAYMLSRLHFTYEHADRNNKAVFFRSGPASTSLYSYYDYWLIITLTQRTLLMFLGLQTYRALSLWVKGDMALENGKGILIKSTNVATGDATNSETAFSEARYGACTVGYTEAAQKLGVTKPKKMACIVEHAMKIAFTGKSVG